MIVLTNNLLVFIKTVWQFVCFAHLKNNLLR
ncbi:MAG: hypothetical protein RJB31_926 [Bacteroidota bacterium]|jgi:hypothetical protein